MKYACTELAADSVSCHTFRFWEFVQWLYLLSFVLYM